MVGPIVPNLRIHDSDDLLIRPGSLHPASIILHSRCKRPHSPPIFQWVYHFLASINLDFEDCWMCFSATIKSSLTKYWVKPEEHAKKVLLGANRYLFYLLGQGYIGDAILWKSDVKILTLFFR